MPYLNNLVAWTLFFATATFGHVGMKLAVIQPNQSFLSSLLSPWGIGALFSWTASALLWAWLLSYQPLLSACSIAVLKYAFLVCAAYLLFKEKISGLTVIGVGFIMFGIFLVINREI